MQLHLDGEPLGEPVDLFDWPDVTTTGLLGHGPVDLAAGPHVLAVEITGANAHAEKTHFVGIDFLRLVKSGSDR